MHRLLTSSCAACVSPSRIVGKAQRRRLPGGFSLIAGLCALVAFFVGTLPVYAEEPDDPATAEAVPAFPPIAEAGAMIPIYVTAATTNRFLIDPASLGVTEEGVVSYVVRVLSPSGGSTVNFEGLRCATDERRMYAFGRGDGTWGRARNGSWARVSSAGNNRYSYVLMKEYFCPGGIAIRNVAEGVDALKRGGHPAVQPIRAN